jgi:hypothetical protein
MISNVYRMYIECYPTSFFNVRIVREVSTHSPENINNCEHVTEEAHYYILLLQSQGLVLLTPVI